jgi:predicted RNase H-like nuclease (RuvC/YqgF family)
MKRLILLFAFLTFAAAAQAQAPDTLCIAVPQLQKAQKEIQDCRQKLEIRQQIINELKYQNGLWEMRARQDSMMISLKDRQISLYNERLEVRDKEIRRLQDKIELKNRTRYLWFAGGAAAILLGSWVAGNAQ